MFLFVCLFIFVLILQKLAPYRSIVYAGLSHATDVSLLSNYADINTDAAKSRAPEENEDQTTKSIEA